MNKIEPRDICVVIATNKKDKRNKFKGCINKRIRSIQVLKRTDEITKDDELQMCSILREIDPNKFSSIEYRPDYDEISKNQKELSENHIPQKLDQLFLYKRELINPIPNEEILLITPVEAYVVTNGNFFYKLDYYDEKLRNAFWHKKSTLCFSKIYIKRIYW